MQRESAASNNVVPEASEFWHHKASLDASQRPQLSTLQFPQYSEQVLAGLDQIDFVELTIEECSAIMRGALITESDYFTT
jgi:hypothetical protein